MKKVFNDLKTGDLIWKVEYKELWVRPVVIHNIWSTYYPYKHLILSEPYLKYNVRGASKTCGSLFIELKHARDRLSKYIKKKKILLEKEIDQLVAEFERYDSLIIPTLQSPSTKSPRMKNLKPGDSVWYVDKGELSVKELRIVETKLYSAYLEVTTKDRYQFSAFPNSSRSINHFYYTEESQAWKYMREWKKSRLKVVGRKMEDKMRELEKYEKV